MLRCEPASGVPPLSPPDNGKGAVYGMTARECNTPAYLVIGCHSLLSEFGLPCRMDVHKCLTGFVGGV